MHRRVPPVTAVSAAAASLLNVATLTGRVLGYYVCVSSGGKLKKSGGDGPHTLRHEHFVPGYLSPTLCARVFYLAPVPE